MNEQDANRVAKQFVVRWPGRVQSRVETGSVRGDHGFVVQLIIPHENRCLRLVREIDVSGALDICSTLLDPPPIILRVQSRGEIVLPAGKQEGEQQTCHPLGERSQGSAENPAPLPTEEVKYTEKPRITNVSVLFDTQRFYRDLDRVRRERHINGSQLARVLGITPARLLVTTRSDNPSIATLAPLALWGGLSLDAYISVIGGAEVLLEPAPVKSQQVRRQRRRREVPYDFGRLYTDLDRVRREREMSWHAIWRTCPGSVPHNLSQYVAKCLPLWERAIQTLTTWANLEHENYRINEPHESPRQESDLS